MKYRIAVGTSDKIHITEHFGKCRQFHILEIDQDTEEFSFLGERTCLSGDECGAHQDDLIREKIHTIKDCQIVLVNKIGGQSEKLLNHNNIIALQYQGTLEEALAKILKFYKKYKFHRKEPDYDRDNCQQEKTEDHL
jgi:nitrogen fixation protein NifX